MTAYILRRIFYYGYKYFLRHIVFLTKSDDTHRLFLKYIGNVQASKTLLRLMSRVFVYKNKVLTQKVADIKFENPIGLSAGFDKNIELVPAMRSFGFGFIEGGSISRNPRAGNQKPWFHRLKKTESIAVHAGVPNLGLDVIAENIKRENIHTQGSPLFISVAVVACSPTQTKREMAEECVEAAKIIDDGQFAKAIEINISCPNLHDSQPFTEPKNFDMLLTLLDEVKLTLPVFVKMPNEASLKKFDALLEIVAKHKVEGVSISNLLKNFSKDIIKDKKFQNVPGGLSGRPTFKQSNELIKRTYQQYGDQITIIGIGGVFNADDAYEKIKNGASLVAMVTGFIFEGPQVVAEINQGVAKLLRKDGYSNIKQAIGKNVE